MENDAKGWKLIEEVQSGNNVAMNELKSHYSTIMQRVHKSMDFSEYLSQEDTETAIERQFEYVVLKMINVEAKDKVNPRTYISSLLEMQMKHVYYTLKSQYTKMSLDLCMKEEYVKIAINVLSEELHREPTDYEIEKYIITKMKRRIEVEDIKRIRKSDVE